MRTLWHRARAWRGSTPDPAPLIDLRERGRNPEEPRSVRGLRVLLIDDNDATRVLLADTLRQYQAEVTAVASAAAARAVVEHVRPQVVVSNCPMDHVEAVTLIQKVRVIETAHHRRIPTIAVTAGVEAKHVGNEFAAGFQVRIPTPVAPHELASIIARLAAADPAPSW